MYSTGVVLIKFVDVSFLETEHQRGACLGAAQNVSPVYRQRVQKIKVAFVNMEYCWKEEQLSSGLYLKELDSYTSKTKCTNHSSKRSSKDEKRSRAGVNTIYV